MQLRFPGYLVVCMKEMIDIFYNGFCWQFKEGKGVGLYAVISKSKRGVFYLACGNCRGLKIIMGSVLKFL